MSQSHNKIALILGASGGVGGETAQALRRHGWRLRGLTRRQKQALPNIEWITGDAMNPADVLRAAKNVSLIVHAVNPPAYRNWDTLVIPMLDHTIAAAKATGARILFPGTIYNFGPDAFPVLTEKSPQHPVTRKGAIRADMEKRLQDASSAGVPALILRAGDYFGPNTTANSYVSGLMVRPNEPVKRIIDPGRPHASHAWAYLPDVGETFARLVEREDQLGTFECFHFAGHQLAPGAMAEALKKAVGNPSLRVWPFPWTVVAALQPFLRLFYEMAEMRYLWSQSIALDGGKLENFLGSDLPATPLDVAVKTTLEGLGCLKERQDSSDRPANRFFQGSSTESQ